MKIIRISSTWCTSCIVTHKDWKKLKELYPDFEYIEYDYDIDDISKYEVGKILPVIFVEKEDKIIKKIVGEKSLNEIQKEIEELV